MLRANLGSKLGYGVDGWIDVPPKSLLCALNQRDDIAERRITNDHQIDVACSVELTPRGGAKHERCVDTVGEWHQRFTQNVDKSGGLREQPSQLRKDCRFLVCLEVHLLAADLAAHQAGSGQQFELALNRADRAADLPYELAQVVRLVGMTQQPSQYAPPRGAEQNGCRVESRRSCSQDGNNRIQNGNARSTVSRQPGH